MTVEKIDAKMAKLREKKEAIQSELRELSAERDTLASKESAELKVLAMSPAERAALGIPEPQTVKAEGIASKEGVGTPGK